MWPLIFAAFFLSSFSYGIEDLEMLGDDIGCYEHHTSNPGVPDLTLVINSTSAAQTVDKCLSECIQHYFRYAGILNGQFCLCGSTFGSQGPRICNQTCYGNSSQHCGDLHAVNVYATGYLVPGPPLNLKVNQTSEERIGLYWEPPDASNGNLTEYIISANVSQTFSNQPTTVRFWTLPSSPTRAGLLGLIPGTQYNVSLAAVNQHGPGWPTHMLIWTTIGVPTQPEVPKVISKGKGTISVRLKPVFNEFGPISKYRVVVSSEEGVLITHSSLKPWSQAQRERLPYYIAAELEPEDVTNETVFVVGDGKRYGGYYNPPLSAKDNFHISLGVISTFEDVTKFSYSSSSLLDVPPVVEDHSDGLSTFLEGAIIVCGFLLVVAIVIYVMIHKKYGAYRYQRRDQQDLSIRGAVTEVENSAFVYDEYLPEDEEDRKVDYYDMLHQRIWNIPRNFLDIHSEVISEGSFGPVYSGTVQKQSLPTPVAIYAIRDGELGGEDKRRMLEGLDMLVRGGDHKNTISLTGTCESQDTLYIVLEHHSATLKEILLQSRCLQHGEYAKSRFCSLSESTLLDFIIGVANGMNYLASKKIVHKQLTSRNVIMAGGTTPKITGFGIANYSRRNRKQDYTRWSAHEVFARRLNVTKSDVWSFGVVLWEVCSLGGTPYSELGSEQVAGAVTQGLRLPQLSYVGDSLYHLMLQCWLIDLDERPAFPDIVDDLESICSNIETNMELSFNTFKDFKYEECNPDLEYY